MLDPTAESAALGSPSWADSFTEGIKILSLKLYKIIRGLITLADDENHYLELAKNQQYIRISNMAQVYKNAASQFVHEAVLLYLESKQEVEIEGQRPILILLVTGRRSNETL